MISISHYVFPILTPFLVPLHLPRNPISRPDRSRVISRLRISHIRRRRLNPTTIPIRHRHIVQGNRFPSTSTPHPCSSSSCCSSLSRPLSLMRPRTTTPSSPTRRSTSRISNTTSSPRSLSPSQIILSRQHLPQRLPALLQPLLARVARDPDAKEEEDEEQDAEEDGEGYDVGCGELVGAFGHVEGGIDMG